MMKLKEIRELQTAELRSKVQQLKQELLTLRFQQVTGQEVNGNKKREVRKEVARILTILKERETKLKV